MVSEMPSSVEHPISSAWMGGRRLQCFSSLKLTRKALLAQCGQMLNRDLAPPARGMHTRGGSKEPAKCVWYIEPGERPGGCALGLRATVC